jgi:hypothetical protein
VWLFIKPIKCKRVKKIPYFDSKIDEEIDDEL